MERIYINLPNKSIFLLLFFFTIHSHAQFYHGIDVGINTSTAKFNVNGSTNSGNSTGFNIGYIFERDISDVVFMRFGMGFNRRTFKVNTISGVTIYNEKWSSDAIEIPINLGYYLNFNRKHFQFFIDVGFNIAYNNRAITKNDNETIFLNIGKDADIKRTAFGANGSIGLLIKKRVKVRLNYYYSLSNISNTEGDTWKNRTLGITINYFLREKEVY